MLITIRTDGHNTKVVNPYSTGTAIAVYRNIKNIEQRQVPRCAPYLYGRLAANALRRGLPRRLTPPKTKGGYASLS